jgi:N4-gp56 family major capsid protein
VPAGITISSSLHWDQTAWELRAYYALRPELYYDAVADVQPTNQSMVGNAVEFVVQSDLATQSTAINESTDVTPLTMADSTVTLTLAEYGAAVLTSALLRGTSFVPLDPVVANVIGFNAGKSLDTIALAQFVGGSGASPSPLGAVAYSTGTGAAPTSRNTIVPTNTFGAVDARLARATLVRNNVPSIGGLYAGFMHPDVSYDFRGQTGSASWRDPHTYSQPGEIWSGEIGAFEAIRFVETPRTPLYADAGSSTTNTDVYGTLVLGRQALAKAYSNADGNGALPRVAPGPITDYLRRWVPMGWYWLGAYGIFRAAAAYRVESASSVGSNASVGANTSL